MLKLSIMSEEELTHIFGNLDDYIPLHEDLLAQLSKATGADGTVGQIGHIVVTWVRVILPKYLKTLSSSDDMEQNYLKISCILPASHSAAKAQCLQGLLQQTAGSQGTAGPEEAGSTSAGLPAALPRVPLQQEAGPVELSGHPSLPPG